MTSAPQPTASIVIPAHNEAATITACLESILGNSEPGEFEVVVACNGCTDRTAELAKSFVPTVKVVETSTADKTAALNLGEREVAAFPRLYLDADVVVDTASVRALSEALTDPDVMVAAPQIEIDSARSTWVVRAYYRVWTRMAWAEASVMGSGLYALSERGRARFGDFPRIGADDYWVNAQFHPDERARVRGARSTVLAAPNLRLLMRRKARVLAYAGLLDDELADAPGRPGPRGAGLLRLARAQPGFIPLIALYTAIALLTNGLAAWNKRRGKLDWVSDR